MKTLVAILTAIILTTGVGQAKKRNALLMDETHYGVGLAQINAGNGHGIGYTFNAGVMKGRKSLEMGLIYSDRESKIAGGDMKCRIFLGNIYSITDETRIYSPYIQYNLMYQKGTSTSPDVVKLGDETYIIPTDPGKVATIGHYLAYGNKFRIMGRAYIDTSLGLGLYQGSLNKIEGPGTWGIHSANHGFTYSFKIGLGYTFN